MTRKFCLLATASFLNVVATSPAFAQAIPPGPAEPVSPPAAGASPQSAAPEIAAGPTAPRGAETDTAGPAGGDTGALAEIVVTAQRRTENLQTVPIAATALSPTALAEKAVTRLSDLQFASPSLSVTDAGLTQSVNIRGIGLSSGSPAVANGVATYLDGLFQPPIVSTTAFYDLAGVEVLRGPQGTLVGSNSTGGAIFINSQNPKLSGVGGYVEGSYGNYDNATAQGALNLPLTSTLAVRAAGSYARHDSYYDDIGPLDNHPGRLDEKSGRIGVLWKPGAFQALYKAELTDRNTGGYAYRPILTTPFAAGRVGDIRTLAYNSPTRNHERAFINSLELRYVLDNGITLRGIGGYQNKRVNNLYDSDATLLASQTQDQFVRERQWSGEVNIISPTTGAFNWILGGYYQRNKINVRILSISGPVPANIETDNDKITTGLFAQAGYHLSDKLEIEVGGRYSHFKVTAVGGVFVGRGLSTFPAGGLRVANTGGAESDARATGKVALNYQLDKNNFLYAFAARGYKPGGFNSATSRFSPETVWDYEAGWKSTLADGHVRTQIGGFWNQYHGFQFSIIDTTTGAGGVTNLPSARIRGFEAQVQAKFGGFSADAGGAFVDSRLGRLTLVNTRGLPAGTLGPQCPAGVASNPPTCFNYTPFLQTNDGGPNLLSPKWTYNGGIQYSIPVSGTSTLTPRLNYAYVGPQFANIFYNRINDRLKGRGILSALLTYRMGQYQVEGYATNLTNKKYVTGQSGNNEFYGAPRQYGVRASVNF